MFLQTKSSTITLAMPKSSPTSSSYTRTVSSSWPIPLFISVLIPIIVGVVLYQLESFEPVSYPSHVLSSEPPMVVSKRNNQMLRGSEEIGVDQLLSPEDVAYDPNSGVIYTGCVDGWVKRVTVNESVGDSRVENWVFTGGRPLGVALGHFGEVIVANADKNTVELENDIMDGFFLLRGFSRLRLRIKR